ncbi:AlwI family type II restriction endonuclease [Campylobacter lari]|uniref:AlwI family type II restriction endonuclease n=1 Tax=Campylobacter lari TaxID=201 RepID=UPI0017E17A24|nr:AlwI family type II restriction endonuclease [Campylobacter lari]EAJ5700907.1 AlwI family type II restriction endonuclease [Campylobacter lari]EHS0799931.1 AlwI family type II restriction endonuclease [Campylobacter lari]EMC9372787.1 AlwI family type II restriction endonuclease [Campylobacter lari]MCR2076881.1 AlwI family type II restriction endonuclease [Campylobacter lari subsp. concheus]MCR2086261.1 AlwI family type II restriction endonuclease [Campylobacter lari subsp. concheus]
MARKNERKILSFSTTIRNPRRICEFLAILSKFENQELTHEIIMNIVKDVLKNKLYIPRAMKDILLKNNFEDKNYIFTDEELNYIIQKSPQNHKEKNFELGWESRFDTWYKLMSEFGFCYYSKNEKILISESGKILINAVYDIHNNVFKDDCDESLIGSIFLNALSKYEIGNPYKKNLNYNNPLRVLLKLLQKLKINNKSPLNIKEIPILLCWHNNNLEELYQYIIDLRNENYDLTSIHFNYSDEVIYTKCLELLESNNQKRFKFNQVIKEAVDEYIRKMRITGVISIRGNGKFIDINSDEIEKVKYIINLNSCFAGNYLDDSEANKLNFYNYMAEIDLYLITTKQISTDNTNKKIDKLKEFANIYQAESIKKELMITCSKKQSSKDDLLKLIDRPLRFEFLTAIYLTQNFSNLHVIPNYKSDDEGYPIFTASGGKADIIAFDENTESYIEVSLIQDRTQTTNEMIPITRHLQEYIKNSTNNKNKFSVFIAPNIHSDVKTYAQFAKDKFKINIPYYNISDFIAKVEDSEEIIDLNDESLLI